MHEVEKHLQFSSPPFFFIRSVLPSFECKTVIYEVLFYPLRLFALCICFPFRDECSFFFFLLPLYHSLPASQTAATLPLKKKKKKENEKAKWHLLISFSAVYLQPPFYSGRWRQQSFARRCAAPLLYHPGKLLFFPLLSSNAK